MFRILVIDDEKDILLMVKKMMERSGYEVDIALNGEQGLRLFKQHDFDLIITDIIMPDKEGIELIMELKKIHSGTRIVAMSGGGRLSAEGYLDMAKRLGADRIFQKPFSQSEMVKAVDELLHTLT